MCLRNCSNLHQYLGYPKPVIPLARPFEVYIKKKKNHSRPLYKIEVPYSLTVMPRRASTIPSANVKYKIQDSSSEFQQFNYLQFPYNFQYKVKRYSTYYYQYFNISRYKYTINIFQHTNPVGMNGLPSKVVKNPTFFESTHKIKSPSLYLPKGATFLDLMHTKNIQKYKKQSYTYS